MACSDFLMGRLPIENFDQLNGRTATGKSGSMPFGRQGDLIVTSSKTIPDAQLRTRFIEEIKKQASPTAFTSKSSSADFTLTSTELPQAFQVLPVMVWRVYAMGVRINWCAVSTLSARRSPC